MASPRARDSPISALGSPSFIQPQLFLHNVHPSVSLNPVLALLPDQVNQSDAARFNGRCRSPAGYSDVSSVTHLPHVDMHGYAMESRSRPCVKGSQGRPQMPPAIIVGFTPAKDAGGFGTAGSRLDHDSLLPPERGMPSRCFSEPCGISNGSPIRAGLQAKYPGHT